MLKSPKKKTQEIDFDFINQGQFEGMSLEQRKWAQNQFRMIYAQQMAKAFSEIQNKNRVKRNLSKIEKQKNQQAQQISERLMQKMGSFQQKRKKRINQKLQAYKMNEEKWVRKMQSIESKFRHQNRQAIQKAQKYRLQSQSFWKNKEQQLTTSREKSFTKYSLNKTQQNLRNIEPERLLNLADKKVRNATTNKKIRFDSVYQIDFRSRMNSDRSRDNLQSSRAAVDIDKQISKRQQKSEMLQKEKQKIIFQNAMKRLAQIQISRKKAQKLKQPSIKPVQIRKPKRKTQQRDDQYTNSLNKNKNKSIYQSRSKDSLIDETIQSHIKAKRLLQEQQFKQRDKIIQNNLQKIRKDKILKAIKNKVHDIKKTTIKNQISIQN